MRVECWTMPGLACFGQSLPVQPSRPNRPLRLVRWRRSLATKPFPLLVQPEAHADQVVQGGVA